MQEEPRLVLVSSTVPRQSPASSPEANSKLLSRCISSNNSLAKPPSSTNLLRTEPGTGRDLLLWHMQLDLAHATCAGGPGSQMGINALQQATHLATGACQMQSRSMRPQHSAKSGSRYLQRHAGASMLAA